MKQLMNDKIPYVFLKITVLLMVLPASVLAIYVLPMMLFRIYQSGSGYSIMLYGLAFGVYGILFFYVHALWNAFKILSSAAKGFFTHERIRTALASVLKDGLFIALILLVLAFPLYIVAQIDDAPAILLIGMIVGYSALAVSAACKILINTLQQLTQKEVIR